MPKSALPTVWDLSPLLTGDADPRLDGLEADIRATVTGFADAWKDRGDWLEDPAVLKDALDHHERLYRTTGTGGTPGYYFGLRQSQDQNDASVKAGANRFDELEAKLGNDIAFFDLRLAALPAEKLAAFAADPLLAPYKHYLERLAALAPYLLSEPEEKILSLKSSVSHSNWVHLSSQLLSSEEVEVATEEGRATKSLEGLLDLISSPDQAVRDGAAVAVNGILRKHLAVVEAEINSVLANKKINDELRGYPRPDTARHLSDDMETEVVDRLIETVASRFDVARRYYALKAKLMGKERLAYHERNVRYGELTRKYPYGEAVELAAATFKDLDPKFEEILRGFAENGQVDVFPAKGKRGGAFCAHNLLAHPTYLLLNHTDNLDDVLTLAHEAGHGINNELMRPVRNALDFGTPMATAEVASTFMEDFVLDRLAADATPEERLAILMMKLNSDVSTIFRQVACYRFELDLHKEFREKSYLDAASIGALFHRHMASYMGEAVEQSEGSENWWTYWSHIRSFFYVYSYASGLLISKSLQASVKDDPAFIEKVKAFLAAGTSASPREIFADLGIDIADAAFWNEGLDRVEALLEETEGLAKELGKI